MMRPCSSNAIRSLRPFIRSTTSHTNAPAANPAITIAQSIPHHPSLFLASATGRPFSHTLFAVKPHMQLSCIYGATP